MKWFIVMGLALGVQSLAAVETAPKTCVNLTGGFVVPLGKHDRTDNPRLIIIRQDHCRLISLVIGYGGMIPIGSDSSLDGTEGYTIVGNTIVQKAYSGGTLVVPTAHGDCETKSVVLSLDENKNLVISAAKATCDDKHRGAFRQIYPRRGAAPATKNDPATSVVSAGQAVPGERPASVDDGLTCTDGNGHSVSFSEAFTFQGLDSVGISSQEKYDVIGSMYVQVPGGPSYAEYKCASDHGQVVVRISSGKTKTAKVWVGKHSEGKSVFNGACGASFTKSASTLRTGTEKASGPGWCMGRPHCQSAGGMFAEDKRYCAPQAKSFLANSGTCYEL